MWQKPLDLGDLGHHFVVSLIWDLIGMVSYATCSLLFEILIDLLISIDYKYVQVIWSYYLVQMLHSAT